VFPYIELHAALGVVDDPTVAPSVSDEGLIRLPATMADTVSISWVTFTFQQRRQALVGKTHIWPRHDLILPRRPHGAGHTRARCGDDPRTLAVNSGSSDDSLDVPYK
jgi:hypothetical protein